jgi:3-hydroxyisobutyrate dehydrogenase-like beta-hydroxyacid dehydrogenase
VIELLSESMTLADKSGVGADLLYEFIKEFLRAFLSSGLDVTVHQELTQLAL